MSSNIDSTRPSKVPCRRRRTSVRKASTSAGGAAVGLLLGTGPPPRCAPIGHGTAQKVAFRTPVAQGGSTRVQNHDHAERYVGEWCRPRLALHEPAAA